MPRGIAFPTLILAAAPAFVQCGPGESTRGEAMEANKEIARRFYEEVINGGKLEKLESLMHPDFRDHLAPPQQPPGIQGFMEFLKMVGTAFPDIQVKIEDVVAESDRVAVRLSISGTHTGPLGEIPPTGKAAKWTGIDILAIEDGKIKGRWSERSLLALMQQLGVAKLGPAE